MCIWIRVCERATTASAEGTCGVPSSFKEKLNGPLWKLEAHLRCIGKYIHTQWTVSAHCAFWGCVTFWDDYRQGSIQTMTYDSFCFETSLDSPWGHQFQGCQADHGVPADPEDQQLLSLLGNHALPAQRPSNVSHVWQSTEQQWSWVNTTNSLWVQSHRQHLPPQEHPERQRRHVV